MKEREVEWSLTSPSQTWVAAVAAVVVWMDGNDVEEYVAWQTPEKR